MAYRHKQLLKIFAKEDSQKDVFIKPLPPRGVKPEDYIAQLQHIHLQDSKVIEELTQEVEKAKAQARQANKDYNALLNEDKGLQRVQDMENEIDSLKRERDSIIKTVIEFGDLLKEAHKE